MDKERRRQLREQYDNRRPDMGIVSWRHGGDIWVMTSTDAAADHNGTEFQLKLGSFPNRELQRAYSADPEGFVWTLEKKLEYEDPKEDHGDDLELLLLEFLDAYPDARPMKPGKKR